MDVGQWELAARLVGAAALGAVVGLERESRGHPAGLRTHALVSVGAALFTMAGAYGFGDLAAASGADPSRVAAQVASGVGFLGAGAIIKLGVSVRGLTTAATLWVSAAVGVALGAGAYVQAVVGAAIVMIVLLAAGQWTNRLAGQRITFEVVEYARGHGTLGPLLRAVQSGTGRLADIRIEDDDDEPGAAGVRRVVIRMQVWEPTAVERVLDALRGRDEILATRVTAGAD